MSTKDNFKSSFVSRLWTLVLKTMCWYRPIGKWGCTNNQPNCSVNWSVQFPATLNTNQFFMHNTSKIQATFKIHTYTCMNWKDITYHQWCCNRCEPSLGCLQEIKVFDQFVLLFVQRHLRKKKNTTCHNYKMFNEKHKKEWLAKNITITWFNRALSCPCGSPSMSNSPQSPASITYTITWLRGALCCFGGPPSMSNSPHSPVSTSYTIAWFRRALCCPCGSPSMSNSTP